jgi:ubiquinone/menaquinone biosynthesis C-methylase UbiE
MLAAPVGSNAPSSSTIDADLLALLRCPECRAGMSMTGAELACRRDPPHTFPVVDGVVVFMDEREVASEEQYRGQRAYFDAQFAGYGRYELEDWRRSYVERIRRAGALGGPGAPVVDVAVGGTGYTVIEAARAGAPAIGCDLSLTGLKAAHRFSHDEGVAERTLFVCCSAERLPLASDAFAAALAVAVLEHVPDDAVAMGELARVLRPGGRGFIMVPHEMDYVPRAFRPANRRHDRRLGHLRRYSAEGLLKLVGEVGLSPVDVRFTGHSVKVAQIVGEHLLRGRPRRRFWWWCERHDLARSRKRRGSMQLGAVVRRPAASAA